KLWQKDYQMDELVERFTVGRDYLLDLRLVTSDCVASLAHARMLAGIGLLGADEIESIHGGLKRIIGESVKRTFSIRKEEEDCHTAIENRLTKDLGDVGKKIHTGRSRNDQVIAALRIFTRARLIDIMGASLDLARALAEFAEKHQAVPMVGRTHMQVAMPSSVGLWAASFAELLLDDLALVDQAFTLNNRSPLGSAASYGVPLPLDRELVAGLLGFAGIQNNVLSVNNSRGKLEAVILDSLDQIGLTLSKLAQDLILFSMPEFGYFRLPEELCSGSSIMPQKRNPDGLELLRAKSSTLSAAAAQVKSIVRGLTSGYNRDFQETKEPFLRGLALTLECLQIARLTVDRLEIDTDRLASSFTPEVFATDAALELVVKGTSFRDAYREVAAHLSELADRDPAESIGLRTSSGTAGNLRLENVYREISARRHGLASTARQIEQTLTALVGESVQI
ncbi:MAG TPA: argininosuccinate lyase, partial [Spirochaetia bacterium]|nr:argininosuccinate lyase [Spirochaetia bacterium]